MMNMSNELAWLIQLRFIWFVQNEIESIAAIFDNVNTSQEDIVLKVLGEHYLRHVRGKGCGAIHTQSNSSLAHNHDKCLAKQLEIENKLTESQEKCEKLQESHATMQESQATLQEKMNESKASQATLQEQMDRLLKHLGG